MMENIQPKNGDAFRHGFMFGNYNILGGNMLRKVMAFQFVHEKDVEYSIRKNEKKLWDDIFCFDIHNFCYYFL